LRKRREKNEGKRKNFNTEDTEEEHRVHGEEKTKNTG
jgi:hypothetical protein